jgi:hypothetical protein
MKVSLSAEHFIRFTVVISLFAFTVSCKEEPDPTPLQTTTAQFTEPTLAVLENGGEKVISLSLDMPARTDGFITLQVNTLVPQTFITAPLASKGQVVLPVAKGQTLVDFKIIPSDNPSLDGCKVVRFSIASMSEGLTPGPLRDVTVSVNDDEAPVEASFEHEEVNIRENDPAAAPITIRFAHAAPAEGILIVRLQSTSKYGTDYTTEPAPVGDKIFLSVSHGATSAMIKVFPLNDAVFQVDRNINFRIIDGDGGVVVGENNSFWCAITEDDGYQLSTISSIRSMYHEGQVTIQGDTYIEGTVTSKQNVASGRVVVEDGTGALHIQITTPHALTKGDVVIVNLNHGVVRGQQGAIEVSQVSIFEKLGEGDVRVNKMTLDELYDRGAELQSQTLQLTGLVFPDADGELQMLGDRVATDGTRTVIVRTNSLASFGDEVVPDGLVNITGILVQYAGAFYLYPQDYTDIKKQTFTLKRR